MDIAEPKKMQNAKAFEMYDLAASNPVYKRNIEYYLKNTLYIEDSFFCHVRVSTAKIWPILAI